MNTNAFGNRLTAMPVPKVDDIIQNVFPVRIEYLFAQRLDVSPDGFPAIFVFLSRNEAFRVESFTLTCRMPSPAGTDAEDPAGAGNAQEPKTNDCSYVWHRTEDDTPCLCLRIRLPDEIAPEDCVVYLSSIRLENEKVYTLEPELFRRELQSVFPPEREFHLSVTETEVREDGTITPIPAVTDIPKAPETVSSSVQGQTGQRRRFLSLLPGIALMAGLVILFFAAQYYFYNRNQYKVTMQSAEILIRAGLREEAEAMAEDILKDNFFYKPYREDITSSAAQLWEEKRYNEAYRILLDKPYASLLQTTCERGAEQAMREGDFETAYVYAITAPESFFDRVFDAARDAAYDPSSGVLDESALRVLLKAGSPDRMDEVLTSMIREQADNGDYLSAVTLCDSLSPWGNGAAVKSGLLIEMIDKQMAENDGDAVLSSLDTYGSLILDKTYIQTTRKTIFDERVAARDLASAAAMASEYGYSLKNVTVASDDPDVRSALGQAYFLLTDKQMRAYHASALSASNLNYTAVGGKLTVQEHGKNKVYKTVSQIAAGDCFALILHTNGSTELFTEQSYHNALTKSASSAFLPSTTLTEKVVAVAAGEKHLVYLLSDGTVRADGDNTYGQCNTKKWKNIVAVAAGKRFTVGLQADGTVVACGSNACGQCDVGGYHNVVDVRACWQSTVLLFSDGTAAIVGEQNGGLADVNTWQNITRIRAGANAVMAETAAGGYLYCGSPSVSVGTLKNLTDFAVGTFGIVVTDASGNVKSYT